MTKSTLLGASPPGGGGSGQKLCAQGVWGSGGLGRGADMVIDRQSHIE